MKFLKTYEKFVSPHMVGNNVNSINVKKPITYEKFAWILPTDDRFKKTFSSIKQLSHFKYPFGKTTYFIGDTDEKFVIILYSHTSDGEKWSWLHYNSSDKSFNIDTFDYLKDNDVIFNGPIGIDIEEYDETLLSLISNKYNL